VSYLFKSRAYCTFLFVFGTFEDIYDYLHPHTAYLLQYDKAENIESKFAELERLPGDLNSQETSVSYSLKNNADLIACKAEYYHQCGEYQKCFELTTA
jgi:hypothetical protein